MRAFRKCFHKDFAVFSDALCILHPISYGQHRTEEKSAPAKITGAPDDF
jgi:hypothetical protein